MMPGGRRAGKSRAREYWPIWQGERKPLFNGILTAPVFSPAMSRPVPAIAIRLARCFVAAAAVGYCIDLWQQTRDHLTNGAGRPFGDDFINYWSGAALALHGHAAQVYDFNAFHMFEQSVAGAGLDYYHYSYPPVLLALTAPLALTPYVPSLFVWLVAGWYAFYRALKLAAPKPLLLALAAPAVFVNTIGGQNGTWSAALLAGGLGLLERRPTVAGVLFAALVYKPHLGVLLPVALVAGRQWRALASAVVTACALVAASVLLYGVDVWRHFAANVTFLRHAILEDGTGVWHRMVSVFVAARRLGATVEAAYAVQAVTALTAAIVVALAWRREHGFALKAAVLLVATCFATPYLQDYDLVFLVAAVAWLWQGASDNEPAARQLQIACALMLLLPMAAAPLGKLTGLAVGPLFLLPGFVLVARAALATPQPGLAGFRA
jgi:hypothetical protein